jgi:hypothetical protein
MLQRKEQHQRMSQTHRPANARVSMLALLVATATMLASCASVNSVSLTPIPSQRSKVVQAQVSKTIFLGFNFDNDFIDPLVEDLKRKCPNGIVSGILTKDETYAYVIVFKKVVTATGYCNNSVAHNPKSQRSTASEEN